MKSELSERKGVRNSQFFRQFTRQITMTSETNKLMEKKISDYVKNLINKLNSHHNVDDNDKNKKRKSINLPPVTLIPFNLTNDTYKILDYIFNKKTKKKNDILYIQHFLTLYDSLIKNLFKTKLLTNPNILLNQLAKYIKLQKLSPNQLLFRYGDRGDYFYFIFQGKVTILIPREIKIEITESQYIEHLEKLRELKEYGLIIKTIDTNINIFHSFSVKELKNIAYDMINKKTSLNKPMLKKLDSIKNNNINIRQSIFQKPIGEIFLIDEYINSVEPNFNKRKTTINFKNSNFHNNYNTNVNDNNEEYVKLEEEIKKQEDSKRGSYEIVNLRIKKHIILYGYYQVATLQEFKTFGDVALAASSSYRTATIISIGKTILGQIGNKVYSKCIKTCMDLVRYKNVSELINIPIFKDIEIDQFNERYFNHFHLSIFKRGDIIFNQKEERKNVYFIKEGEIELFMKGSIVDINKIINEFSPNDINERNKILKGKTNEDDILSVYYNKDKEINNWRILSQYPSDVFGLDDCLFNGNYFVSAICKTGILKVYEIEIKVFDAVCNSVRINENYLKYIKFKKNQMLERLKHIRETYINHKYKERENAFKVYAKSPKLSFPNEYFLNINLIKKKFQEINSNSNSNISILKTKTKTNKNNFNESSCRINLKKKKINSLIRSSNYIITENSLILNSPQNYNIKNKLRNFFTPQKTQTQISTSSTFHNKTKQKISFKQKINKRNNYSSSLCNYIKTVKNIKLTQPKINAFSELMFEISNSNNNYYSDDDVNYKKNEDVKNFDVLAFDNIMQKKINSPIFNITKNKLFLKTFSDGGLKGKKIKFKYNSFLNQK